MDSRSGSSASADLIDSAAPTGHQTARNADAIRPGTAHGSCIGEPKCATLVGPPRILARPESSSLNTPMRIAIIRYWVCALLQRAIDGVVFGSAASVHCRDRHGGISNAQSRGHGGVCCASPALIASSLRDLAASDGVPQCVGESSGMSFFAWHSCCFPVDPRPAGK